MFRFLSRSNILIKPLSKHSPILPNLSSDSSPFSVLSIPPKSLFLFELSYNCTNLRKSITGCMIGGWRAFCSGSGGRESLHYDVVIVGAGPAGLSAAIRLKQLCLERKKDLSVCVLEKGSEVGAHIISGNVFETRALDELLPNWRLEGAPIEVPVSSDKFWLLTENKHLSLPSPFDNKGNYVIRMFLCQMYWSRCPSNAPYTDIHGRNET